MTDPQSPAASAPDPTLQSLIDDRFQVIDLLGRGGMGAVYRVYDRETCRELALKRLHPETVGHPDVEERFRREYRALGALSHPGVPRLYHTGRTVDGAPWFTMEIVRGVPLRALLDRGPLPPARALDLAIELGHILAAAHAAGVIHRDVKPGNILLESGDRVRLLDFGVCSPLPRFLRAIEARRRTAAVDRWETGEAHFVGTIGYSDPATHDGSPATIRSDIFSLAAITYELLTGRRLFDSDGSVFRSIDSAEFPVPLAALVVDLRRATATHPFERHCSMAEFVQRLEISRGHLQRAHAEATPPRRFTPTSLLLGLAVGLTTALALERLTTPPATALTRPPAPHPSPSTQPTAPSQLTAPAPSPTHPTAPSQTLAPSPTQPTTPTPTQPTTPSPIQPTADPDSALTATPSHAVPGAPGRPTPDPRAPRRPAAASATADPGNPRALVRRHLTARTPAIARCIHTTGAPQTRLTVTLDLTPGGLVRAVRLASGERSGLSRCVSTALSDMSFPPGTPILLTHTFQLPRP